MYNFTITSYIFIIVNLLIVSILLVFRKQNSLSNIILGIYVFMHVIVFALNTLLYLKLIEPDMYLYSILPSALIGPLVYFFSQSVFVEKRNILRIQNLLHFAPAIIYFALLKSDSLIVIDLSKSSIEPAFIVGNGSYPAYMNLIMYFQLPLYKLISLYLFNKRVNEYKLTKKSITHKIKYGWNFLVGTSIFLGVYYVYRILSISIGTFSIGDSVVSPFILFCMFIFIIISAMRTSSIYNEKTLMQYKKTDKSQITESELYTNEKIDRKIEEIISKHKIYKDPSLNLKIMSDRIDIPSRQLSHYINQKYNKNFNDYINGFRVEEAKRLLLEEEYEHLKLDAIGEKAGFSSRASFFANFKKHTGETPAIFKKEHFICLNSDN